MAFSIQLQSNALTGLRRGVLLLAGTIGLGACGAGHETDCLKSNSAVTTQRRAVDRRVRISPLRVMVSGFLGSIK